VQLPACALLIDFDEQLSPFSTITHTSDRSQQYLDEFLFKLPYDHRDGYRELAPSNWPATRATLDPDELNTRLRSFTMPAD